MFVLMVATMVFFVACAKCDLVQLLVSAALLKVTEILDVSAFLLLLQIVSTPFYAKLNQVHLASKNCDLQCEIFHLLAERWKELALSINLRLCLVCLWMFGLWPQHWKPGVQKVWCVFVVGAFLLCGDLRYDYHERASIGVFYLRFV